MDNAPEPLPPIFTADLFPKLEAKPGPLAQFNIAGECGGSRYLFRESKTWKLMVSPAGEKISETAIPQEIAWRIFTKGISREEARQQVSVSGDAEIGLHVLDMISIVG